jgi:multicomponent Na+:H+ antiporter subunit F
VIYEKTWVFWVILGAGCAILVGIAMLLVRAFAGPTVFDRVLATNAMGTKTVIFVSLLGFIQNRPEFIDTALTYAIINFVSTIALLKFIQFKRIG